MEVGQYHIRMDLTQIPWLIDHADVPSEDKADCFYRTRILASVANEELAKKLPKPKEIVNGTGTGFQQ